MTIYLPIGRGIGRGAVVEGVVVDIFLAGVEITWTDVSLVVKLSFRWKYLAETNSKWIKIVNMNLNVFILHSWYEFQESFPRNKDESVVERQLQYPMSFNQLLSPKPRWK